VGIRGRRSIDLPGMPERSDLQVYSDVPSSLALPGIGGELQLSCQPLPVDTPEIDTPEIDPIKTASERPCCDAAAVQTLRTLAMSPNSRPCRCGPEPTAFRSTNLRRKP
jgi:hypothetical protein